jgi:hypothetical protein
MSAWVANEKKLVLLMMVLCQSVEKTHQFQSPGLSPLGTNALCPAHSKSSPSHLSSRVGRAATSLTSLSGKKGKKDERGAVSKAPKPSGLTVTKGFATANANAAAGALSSLPRTNIPPSTVNAVNADRPQQAYTNEELKDSRQDDLTLYQLARMLADVRKHYRQTSTIGQDTVRRNLHGTRISMLNLCRCRAAPSTLSGAGQGLFATRDIAAEELITCYPGDVVLCWEVRDSRKSGP